ncbi:MAG: phage integrase SAM-like domain-containing protein, partial [Verrucomicrobiae bacterium]|nr:phage integrase SAM-like domain-containing protein [Verrucomicrobiae bacterium]
MATVFKRENSKYWQAAYTGVSGSRIYKSTGQTKKGKALAVAAEMESRARNLDPAGQQEQRALLAVLEEATAQALRGKLTIDLARDHLDRLLSLSGGGHLMEAPSMEQWFRGWLRDKQHSTSTGTYERYQGIVEQFLESLAPERRSAAISTLKIEEVREFRDRQRGEGRSASTVNLLLKTIRVALNPAVHQGFLRTNPAEAVETVRIPRAPKVAFTFDQVMAVAAKAREKADESRTARERDLYRDWEVAILTAY